MKNIKLELSAWSAINAMLWNITSENPRNKSERDITTTFYNTLITLRNKLKIENEIQYLTGSEIKLIITCINDIQTRIPEDYKKLLLELEQEIINQ
jgi:hypothetical protein